VIASRCAMVALLAAACAPVPTPPPPFAPRPKGDVVFDPLNPCTDVFDRNAVHTLRIDVADEDWNALRADSTCEVYVPAQFRMDDEEAITIGVRRKSGFVVPQPPDQLAQVKYACSPSTDVVPDPLPIKPPLKLDFNEFVDEQRWHGLRKLNLENGGDEALIREGLAWWAMEQAHQPASCAAWARVEVNGAALGLYLLVEQIDNTFLRKWLDDDSGHLWKGLEQQTCAGERDFDAACVDDTRDLLCFPPFVEGDQVACEGPSSETWATALPPLVDVDSLLRTEAVNAFIANSHSLFVGRENYFYYNPPAASGPRHYFPSDLDTVMRSIGQDVGLGDFSPYDFHTILLRHPDYRPQFETALTALLEGALTQDKVDAELSLLENVLAPHLPDELTGTTVEQFDELRTWWTARADNVRAQLSAE
jgi:hypothetical protein